MLLRSVMLSTLLLMGVATLAETSAPAAPAAGKATATGKSGVDDDGPSNPCVQWGRVARGILMDKQMGRDKRKSTTKLDKQLLDAIYDHDTTGKSLEWAYSLGYQTCLPMLKDGLH